MTKELVAKYGIGVVGFVAAAIVYMDFRDYMRTNMDVLQEVAISTAVHTEAIRSLTKNVEWLIREESQQRTNERKQ